jgi:hypothetical protein
MLSAWPLRACVLVVINRIHLHSPGGVQGRLAPSDGGSGLPAAGGKAAYVTATTPTLPMRTARRIDAGPAGPIRR